MPEIVYEYLGVVAYPQAVQLMESKFQEALEKNRIFFWGLEHEKIYTAGLMSRPEHIIQPELVITKARRGGSVTVHNRGQLVYYTVAPLNVFSRGPEAMIRMFESAIIDTLRQYQITGFTYPPHSGVFSEKGKIAFVGLGLRHNCIYHGICLNVNNDLSDYDKIFSCGLTLPVTKMANYAHLKNLQLSEVSEHLHQNVLDRFTVTPASGFREKIKSTLKNAPSLEYALRLGINYFNERRFWEAHEAWEIFWADMPSSGERTYLHGLIQLAGTYHKIFEKPNVKGAISLLQKALQKLQLARDFAPYLAFEEAFLAEQQELLGRLVTAPETATGKSLPLPRVLRLARDEIKPALAGL